MRIVALLLFTNNLLAVGADHWEVEWSYRLRLMLAVLAVTDNPEEQLILAQIPRFESNYREDVGECKVLGSAGEVTAWQILPRSPTERARLCVSLEGDAQVALERIRESMRACRSLPRRDRLALYARGRCLHDTGRRLSRHRTPTDAALARYRGLVARENVKD